MTAIDRKTISTQTNKGKALTDLEDRVVALEAIDESTGGPTVLAEVAMDTTSPATATAGRGVVLGTGAEGQVSQLAVAGMAVRVQTAGIAINNQGKEIVLPTKTSLTIATADATNARKDIVVLTTAGAIAVRTGTPAGSPADPTLTAGDVPLARIAVAALAASILTANITDLRSRGGVTGASLTAASVALTKVSPTNRKTAIFRGKASAGAITGLTGLAVGDRVESVTLLGTAADKLLSVLSANTGNATITQPDSRFETSITVTDQLQQASASDLSASLFLLTVIPAAA